jgi:hypothetical protein
VRERRDWQDVVQRAVGEWRECLFTAGAVAAAGNAVSRRV